MLKADMFYYMISTINKKINTLLDLMNKISLMIECSQNTYACEICNSEDYEIDKTFRLNGHMYRYAHCKKCNTRVKQEIINKYITNRSKKVKK